MSLTILKAGILDTLQDLGRWGHQHLGINPTGVMDKFSACVANALVGNSFHEAVLEMHFPAATILFTKPTLIALCGADFSATINQHPIPMNTPIFVSKNTVLKFNAKKNNTLVYLAVQGGFNITSWKNSYATNLLTQVGGYKGRRLLKNDVLEFKPQHKSVFNSSVDFKVLPWKATELSQTNSPNEFFVLPGNEWNWLPHEMQQNFLSKKFSVGHNSNRMGFSLSGPKLRPLSKTELISSAVCFGTLQLLPTGQLIVLMADHQTTGGYPRIGNIISAHLSRLAQLSPTETLFFSLTNSIIAEKLFLHQQQHLRQLQISCTLKLENFFRAIN